MAEGLAEDPERAEERQQHRAPPDSVGDVVRVAVPQHDVEPVGQHREEGKERDEDDDQIVHARLCSSPTVAVILNPSLVTLNPSLVMLSEAKHLSRLLRVDSV